MAGTEVTILRVATCLLLVLIVVGLKALQDVAAHMVALSMTLRRTLRQVVIASVATAMLVAHQVLLVVALLVITCPRVAAMTAIADSERFSALPVLRNFQVRVSRKMVFC